MITIFEGFSVLSPFLWMCSSLFLCKKQMKCSLTPSISYLSCKFFSSTMSICGYNRMPNDSHVPPKCYTYVDCAQKHIIKMVWSPMAKHVLWHPLIRNYVFMQNWIEFLKDVHNYTDHGISLVNCFFSILVETNMHKAKWFPSLIHAKTLIPQFINMSNKFHEHPMIFYINIDHYSNCVYP